MTDPLEELLRQRAATQPVAAPVSPEGAMPAPTAAPADGVEALLAQRAQAKPEAPVEPGIGLTPKRGWGETLLSGVANLPSSTWEMAKGIGTAVMNPSETAGHVMDLLAGELQAVTPRPVEEFINRFEVNPQSAAVARQTADRMNELYKQRYGSMEGFKQTLAEDPASVLADVATVATAGGGVASKLGAARTAEALNKFGTAVNPVTAVPTAAMATAKGASKLLGEATAQALGSQLATGKGATAIRESFKAGKEGGTDFMRNLTGKAPIEEVLDTAKQNLSAMKADRQTAYRSGMVDISSDKTVLNLDKIDDAVKTAAESGKYGGNIVNKSTVKALNQVKEAIDEWKAGDPNVFRTPEGLDKLKQRVWSIREGLGIKKEAARNAVGDVYSKIREEIANQAPAYNKIMGDYAEASNQIRDISKELAMGPSAKAETAINRLKYSLKASGGHQGELARALLESGEKSAMPALAGQAMGDWLSKGLTSNLGSGAILYGASSNPALAALLPLQSPRVVGAGAYALGKAAGIPSKAAAATGITPEILATMNEQARKAALAGMLLRQTQQGNQ